MLAAAVGTFLLSGCGGTDPAASTLPDGEYTGQSAAESDGTYGVVTFTVAGGQVTDASFVVHDEDGTPHDEDYGLGSDGTPADQQFYQRAQNAIAAEREFVTDFEETGDQNQVESIAGASLSHRLFMDAVAEAIGGAGS
jgi:Major membrane immunogen, membrane-anchored lipoprotein